MPVTNLVALQFAMGYQGGTIHQMADRLRVSTDDILNADDEKMGDLLRKAQGLHVARTEMKRVMKALETAHSYLSKAVADGLLEECCMPLSLAMPKIEKAMNGED